MAEWKFTIRVAPSATTFGPVPVGEDGMLVDTPLGEMVSFGPKEANRIKQGAETGEGYRIDVQADGSAAPNEATRQLKLSTLALKRMALEDLRTVLDGEGEKSEERARPSWDYPIAYFRVPYPIKNIVKPPPGVTDPLELGRWFSDLLTGEWSRHGETLSTLEAMTRYAAFAYWDGRITPVVPSIFLDRYTAMTHEERREFGEGWLSITAHADRFTERDGKAVPGEDASVHIACGGKELRASIVFDVFPLFINAENDAAFYLVRAGIAWEGSLGSPATWEEAERAELWTAIFKSIDLQAAQLQGEPTPEFYETGVVDIYLDESGNFLSSPKMVFTAEVKRASELLDELQAKGRAEAFAGSATERLVAEQEARETFAPHDGVSAEVQDVFSFAVAPATYSSTAFGLLKDNSKLFRLPRNISRAKTWDALKRERIAYLQNEFGFSAFSSTDEHGNAVKPSLIHKGEEVFLSKAEEKELRLRYGLEGFLEHDSRGRLAFYRCHEDEQGKLIEHRLSWDRTARLFSDGLSREKRELEQRLSELSGQFDLDDEYKKRVEQLLANVKVADHCHILRALILSEVSHQRSAVVELKASDVAVVLWKGAPRPRDWLTQIKNALDSLRDLVLTFRVDGKSEGVRQFVLRWDYEPAGKGGRGDGFFYALVDESFLGHMIMFAADGKVSRGGLMGRAYDFTKRLSADEKQRNERGVQLPKGPGHILFDLELQPEQQALSLWMSAQLTRQKDPVREGHKAERVHPKHATANEPRLYDNGFCPLLPEGDKFISPLSAFKHQPETGRTLFGTQTTGTKKSGGRTGGLLDIMDYKLPPGRAHRQRHAIIAKALDDIEAVVVAHYGGIVVGRIGSGRKDEWFSLDDIRHFSEANLKKVKFYFFVPPNAYDKLQERAEKKLGKRLTPNIEEARAARRSQLVEFPRHERGEGDGAEPSMGFYSLPSLIHETLSKRDLKRSDFARIFGVSKMAVSHWLHGLKDGEDPANAKRIAPDLVPLIMRWIETGHEPTIEEVAALPSRQKGARAS